MIAHTRARPVRVAFLVEENENWKEMLLAIFSNCYSRWGGRFNIIVPCKDGQLNPSFIPWIEAYDPDIIYSYVQFDNSMWLDFQEKFDPAKLEIHQFRESGGRIDYRPNDSVCGLSSLSTLLGERDEVIRFQYKYEMGQFLDKEWNVDFSFLDYNFGTYRYCLGQLPDRDSPQWQNIYVLTPEDGSRTTITPHLPPPGLSIDKKNLLVKLQEYGNIRHASILSAWRAPRAKLRLKGIDDSFLLIVGDTFEDYLLFWNSRSHVPQQYDENVVSLIVSKQDMMDDSVRECITEIIVKHNVVKYSTSSNCMVSILSTSESQDTLQKIVRKLKVNEHSLYKITAYADIDNAANSLTLRDGLFHDISYDDWDNPKGWTEFSYSGDSFRPPSIEPRYFGGFSVPSRYMHRGVWVQDVDIQKEQSKWKYINVKEFWMFPRKFCFARCIFPDIDLWSYYRQYWPRSNFHGRISVFSKLNKPLPKVKLPDEESMIIRAISMPVFASMDSAVIDIPMRKVTEDVFLSDKGRYLTALLNIAGGHSNAREIFLHPFWLQCFDDLGAKSMQSEKQQETIVQFLDKYDSKTRSKDAEKSAKAANRILQLAQGQEKKQHGMRHSEVVESYMDFLKEHHRQEADQQNTDKEGANQEDTDQENNGEEDADQEDIDEGDVDKKDVEWELDKRMLNKSIQHLVGRNILRPGVEWRCMKCLNRNWVSVNDLMIKNTCDVCNSTQTMEIPMECLYVLDGFIMRGLHRHGLLACIWCLAYLREIAKHSFGFCCSVVLIESSVEEKSSDKNTKCENKRRELDILAVVDRKLYLCEVKSSTIGVSKKDWVKFTENAKLIRPDVALMAVRDEESKSLRDEFNKVKEKLKSENIEAELYTRTQSKEGPPSRILPTD